ncbi:unnamed protein product [Lampetra planeri]
MTATTKMTTTTATTTNMTITTATTTNMTITTATTTVEGTSWERVQEDKNRRSPFCGSGAGHGKGGGENCKAPPTA